MHAACNLICVLLDPYDACVKLNNQALFAFQYNLLPAYTSLHKNKVDSESRLSDEQQQQQPLLPLKGQDTQSAGRKQWNWAGMVAVNNAGGRLPGFMVWDPAPNPPPLGPSSFLRCTVVYTWATMNHSCWKKRGRTMKQ